jgi:PAS domain S-box-containing protein
MINVLVIDDDLALLNVMQLVLERSKELAIQPVRSSKEALETLKTKTFDVIVADYDLPEINGIALLKILRGAGDVTPVIIFTGVGREHAAIEALNNGATFFLKKGEDPKTQFLELEQMIRHAVDQRILGKPLGTNRKILVDMINFSLDALFALDRDGKVIAWNRAMEQLTGVQESEILGKGDYVYSECLFGKRQKMLVNLVFEPESEIRKQEYMVISREKDGPVIAVTRAKKPDGREWTLWMKALPLFDNHGDFIAVVGIIRDVTTTFKDVSFQETFPEPDTISKQPAAHVSPAQKAGLVDKLLGKATAHYKRGVHLYIVERDYHGAIAAFDQALALDDTLAYVWNDRGVCYRITGNYDEALKSLLRAVELAPDNTEILNDLGETLEQMGIIHMDNKYLEAAIQTFKMVANSLPNNMAAWNHIGVCLKEMGQAEKSRFYFDRARDINVWKKDTPIQRKRQEFL